MYGTKPLAAATPAATLAFTGVNTGLYLITALVMIVVGVTAIRMATTSPRTMLAEHPVVVPKRRFWRI